MPLSRALAQNQIAFAGGREIGKLPNFVFHPHAENEILPLFPRADPFVLVEKKTQPWASGLPGFSITVVGTRPCVLRNSMNSAATFSYSRKRAVFSSVSLRVFLIWRSVSKTFVSMSFCNRIGEFRGILIALMNVVMTNEVDPHVRRILKPVLAGVRHA